MKLIRYDVRDLYEETDCDQCGCPLEVGSVAFLDDRTGAVCCSRSCHERRAKAGPTPRLVKPEATA